MLAFYIHSMFAFPPIAFKIIKSTATIKAVADLILRLSKNIPVILKGPISPEILQETC